MAGLSKKESARLISYVESQGVKVSSVKSGYMLKFPNGESTTMHLTGSDNRGPLNLRAVLKRNGIEWPTDNQDIKLNPLTVQRGSEVLEKMGFPNTIRMRDFRTAATLIEWNVPNSTIGRFLRSMGYVATGNTQAQRYILAETIESKEYAEAVEIANMDLKPEPYQPIVSITPEPLPALLTKETTLEVREFLDTHDSWTVNMDILPDTITLGDMKLMFAAMGISFEVRVWK